MSTYNMFVPNGQYPGQYLPNHWAVTYNPSLHELLDGGDYTLRGSTAAVYEQTNGVTLKFGGVGLTYNANNGTINGGTITSLELVTTSGNLLMQSLTGLNVSAATFYKVLQQNSSWASAELFLSGNDTINGSSGNDEIWAHAGNDTLKGGLGGDNLVGGRGTDTYDGGGGSGDTDQLSFEDANWDSAGASGVLIDAQAGTATDPWGNKETFVGIERFKGTQFADTMFGSSGEDQFRPLGGKDVIDGRGGTDVIDYGRDEQYDGTAGVTVDLQGQYGMDGFGARDTLKNIEDVWGTEVNDNISGSTAANTLFGRGGNDRLDGRSGADHMVGGGGNDTYVVDNAGDLVDESKGYFGLGVDTILSSVTIDLTNTAQVLGTVEKLTLTGNGDLDGTGNSAANTLSGNSGANTLAGADGKDTLNGNAGNDTLNGGSGNDKLSGGLGNDMLVGGSGKDIFIFNAALDATLNLDTINDFIAADDTIKLENTGTGLFNALAKGTLSLDAFWTGSAAHDVDDRIIYDSATGALLYDADGSGDGAAVQFAILTSGLTLTSEDFVVI